MPKDLARAEKPNSPTESVEPKSSTKSLEVARFTAIAGFIIGLIIAWSGVHTLGVFFSFDSMDNPNNETAIERVDSSKSVDSPDATDNTNVIDSSDAADNPDVVDSSEPKAKSIKEILFASVDAILTAGVIAGGSKGIHELTNAYKEFMQSVKERAA